MGSIPFSEARARFAQTLSAVEKAQKPTVISRRGRPSVVMMSVAQYEKLGGTKAVFANQLTTWRELHRDVLTTDDTDPWGDVRDTSEGRPSPW